MYRKRLKEKVKNKIIYHEYYINLEDQINTLYKFIDIIIKLDNQLYKCRLKKNLK